MRYLLVILDDETTIEPDTDLFEFESDAPDTRNAAACLDRILDVCDQDKLGKRAVLELTPDYYKEAPGSNRDDLQTHFDFTIKGNLL